VLNAVEALTRLREGNRRFVAGQSSAALSSSARREELVSGQEPFAIILGCSDSRVPAELVFDQSFGDLFVIRVAGNIVAPSQVGSVEFAASRYGTRLVVVMGHTQCGAILATLEELQGISTNQSKNLRSIVDRVRPSVEPLLSGRRKPDLDGLVRDAEGQGGETALRRGARVHRDVGPAGRGHEHETEGGHRCQGAEGDARRLPQSGPWLLHLLPSAWTILWCALSE